MKREGIVSVFERIRGLSLRTKTLVIIAFVAVLYILGFTLALMPAVLVINALFLPMPSILRSWLSRILASLLIVFSLLQLAASIQFVIFPNSNFNTLAVLFVLIDAATLVFLSKWQKPEKLRIVNKYDLSALIVVAFFLLPFSPIFMGNKSLARIAETSGYQVVDSTIHYSSIAQMSDRQHFLYKPGGYYPTGFHISVAFMQSSAFDRPYDIGWRNNAILFFMQYISLGSLLAYSIYYLALRLISRLKTGILTTHKGAKYLLAFSIGPPLALVYILPFMVQGFLNYLYVCAAIVMGLLYLAEYDLQRNASSKRLILIMYLLLAFGAGSSWPLLIPPLVGIGLLFFVSPAAKMPALRGLLSWSNSLVLLAFFIQLIPLVFQMYYAGTGGQAGINATGNLYDLHYLVVAAAIVMVAAICLAKRVIEPVRRLVYGVFMPFIVFIGILLTIQYFQTGEARYYVIKCSLLFELLSLALFGAVLLWKYYDSNIADWRYSLFIMVIPLFTVMLLISPIKNPLRETRELLKTYSAQEKPAYYDQDVQIFVTLGEQGKLKHFNATVLHYDPKTKIISGYMQLPFWANVLHQDASNRDMWAWRCNDYIYTNLAYGTATKAEQKQLIKQVKSCAKMIHGNGQTYYVVTNKESVPYLRRIFGNQIKLAY